MAGPVRKILLELVLEDAIIREENAYRFYGSAMGRVDGREEKQLLKKLCAEELRHRLKLEEMQRRGDAEQLEFPGSGELEPGEPDSLDAEQSWPEVTDRASCRDILELALLKENQAVRYYRFIAGRSVLKVVKDLFLFLAEEESEHVRWVEKMLVQP